MCSSLLFLLAGTVAEAKDPIDRAIHRATSEAVELLAGVDGGPTAFVCRLSLKTKQGRTLWLENVLTQFQIDSEEYFSEQQILKIVQAFNRVWSEDQRKLQGVFLSTDLETEEAIDAIAKRIRAAFETEDALVPKALGLLTSVSLIRRHLRDGLAFIFDPKYQTRQKLFVGSIPHFLSEAKLVGGISVLSPIQEQWVVEFLASAPFKTALRNNQGAMNQMVDSLLQFRQREVVSIPFAHFSNTLISSFLAMYKITAGYSWSKELAPRIQKIIDKQVARFLTDGRVLFDASVFVNRYAEDPELRSKFVERIQFIYFAQRNDEDRLAIRKIFYYANQPGDCSSFRSSHPSTWLVPKVLDDSITAEALLKLIKDALLVAEPTSTS